VKIIDYQKRYKNDVYALQAEQWGDGSDSDEIFENLEQYKIKLVENDGGGSLEYAFGILKNKTFATLT